MCCCGDREPEQPREVIYRALSRGKFEPWDYDEASRSIIKSLDSEGFVIIHRGY